MTTPPDPTTQASPVIARNLRHLRLFQAVVETGSLTRAAEICLISQPAVTQAIAKMEQDTAGPLFDRTRQGIFPTPRGEILAHRVRRAFALLDPSLTDLSPRLHLTATTAQLIALISVCEAENFTLAANQLGLAQPTVHRAVSKIEAEAGRPLFQRSAFGLIPSRAARALAQAAKLAFAELDQAESDLAEFSGSEAGRIVIGALPLSRSVLLPRVLARFRGLRPRYPVEVIDGRYDALLRGLRRGEIDFILGALRQPAPIGDVTQEWLFDDRITIIAGNHHPFLKRDDLTLDMLRDASWVVPRKGTPTRDQFDQVFGPGTPPTSLIEAGSILLMRGILEESDHLGCISGAQAQAETERGLVSALDLKLDWPARPIGLTYRANWEPTKAQSQFLGLLREHAKSQPA